MALKWMHTGAASAALAKKEETLAEQRKSEFGKAWRFYLKDDEEARITFVDGDLSDEGYLCPPRFYEHNLQQNGRFGNFFVCPQETHPESGQKCPICEEGDRPALVALFTVIDHREYENKDGKVIKDQVRLLAAKPHSFDMLNKLASKKGGLAGTTWDVTRSGDKSASIGSNFSFVEKNDVKELYEKYKRSFKDKNGKMVTEHFFQPLKYEEEITFRTEETLRTMGFGSKPTTGKSPVKSFSKSEDTTDYQQHL